MYKSTYSNTLVLRLVHLNRYIPKWNTQKEQERKVYETNVHLHTHITHSVISDGVTKNIIRWVLGIY